MNHSKKLKCAAPDLQVEVGPEKKVYEYVGVVLAARCAYVDSLLATPMKEQQTRRLTFPEIYPKVWDKMMRFLEEGGSDMTFEDAVEVIPFYEKYRFEGGINIVDTFLARQVSDKDMLDRMKHFIVSKRNGAIAPLSHHPMAWFIPRMQLSHTYNLEKASEVCIESLEGILQDEEARIVIWVRHWMDLAPIVVEDSRLWGPISEVLLKVGESNTDNFVAGSRQGGSTMIFKLLRALYEREYAEKKGVRFS
jgi:hypothetical protein